MHVLVVVAGADDGADVGVEVAKGLETFLAAHAADDGDVEDDSIVGPADVEVAFVEGDRFLAVFREVVFVVEALEHVCGERRDLRVVVHEQNAAGAEAEGRSAARLDFDGSVGAREENGERGAGADDGVDAELAAVFADDGEHGGEAEAGAVFFRGEERIEDLFEIFRGDAAAVVANFELDVIAGGERRNLVGGEVGVGGAELQLRAVRSAGHRLEGVDDEVLEDLKNLSAIDADGLDVFGDLEGDFGVGAGGGDLDGVGEDVFRGDDALGAGAAFGEHQELFRETLGGEAGFFGVVEGGVVAVVFGERDAAEDGGEKIVEVVGDAAGEETEGFEAVGFDELLGGEGHLGGVAENDDDAARFAGGIVGGAGGPDDRACLVCGYVGRGGSGREQGVFGEQRKRAVGGQRAVARIVGGAARFAADEAEDVAERLVGELFGREMEKAEGGGIGVEDFSDGVGDEHAFGERGEGVLGERGGEFVAGQRGGEDGGSGSDEADDAGEIAFAGERAVGAEEDGKLRAILAVEEDGFDEVRLSGSAKEEPRVDAAREFVGREGDGERGELVGEFVVAVAEGFFPGGGEPEGFVGEIEVEGAERAGAAEKFEPFVVGEGGFLELLAFGDVEVEADDAFEFAGGGEDLDADALDPHPVAEPVLHAELDGEWAGADGEFAAELIGGGGGVVGMDELAPGFERVGKFGVDVAENFFPGRRVGDAAGAEIEIEETGGAFVGEQGETRIAIGAVDGRCGCDGGGLDGGDVGVGGGFFEANANLAGGALARLGEERRGVVECGAEDDLPLGLEPVGLVGRDLESEEGGERFAVELVLGGLPESARGLGGARDPAGGVEEKDGGEVGGGRTGGERSGGRWARVVHGWSEISGLGSTTKAHESTRRRSRWVRRTAVQRARSGRGLRGNRCRAAGR